MKFIHKIELFDVPGNWSTLGFVPYTGDKYTVSFGTGDVNGGTNIRVCLLVVTIKGFFVVRIVGGENFCKEVENKLLFHEDGHHEKAYHVAVRIAKREMLADINANGGLIQLLCGVYDDGFKAGQKEVKSQLSELLSDVD
jgi:hypothetical protein